MKAITDMVDDATPRTPAVRSVGFILKGYPRLSETFIAQEILGLEERGLNVDIISLRHPTEDRTHPVHDAICATVTYLPEYLHHEPWRVLRGWRVARRLPGYRAARQIWWRDLWRDLSRNRIRRFGQALVLAAEAPPTIVHLHAHFLHTPASVTRYTALMRGMHWTASAHARDIWTSPDWELQEKLRDCQWVVTCTALNDQHLSGLADDASTVELVYHGLDLDRFQARAPNWSERDGSDASQPVRLLSVGRAVEKKGYDDLLEALAKVDSSLHWHLTHIGGGALSKQLKNTARTLGLEGRITWLGAQAQEAVLQAYRDSDLFVLASRIAADGDRDGLPNVLVEAQSQGLASVTTSTSAIPELVTHGVNGLLCTPNDPASLADALGRAMVDPALRAQLGEAGRDIVHSQFSMDRGLARLLEKFMALDGVAHAIHRNDPDPRPGRAAP
jgi:glycosyltransferase involved in cell wall biosynthesis